MREYEKVKLQREMEDKKRVLYTYYSVAFREVGGN